MAKKRKKVLLSSFSIILILIFVLGIISHLLPNAKFVGEEIINGSALLDKLDYEDWIKHIEKSSNPETVDENWVEASTFFVIRETDQRIIGMVDIRHRINKFLALFGGHIGYSVRPSERKKGYGTKILEMALKYAKTINIQRVMLACYKENEGSRKIIVKCGGKLAGEYTYIDNKIIQIYWIDN